jgi:hypothetical protein
VLVSDGTLGSTVATAAVTTDSSIELLGVIPGAQYCFQVELSESGVDGELSSKECITGTAARAAGDLDCNGAVETADLGQLVDHLFGGDQPTCGGYDASDVNLDGLTDASDLALLASYVTDPL